MQLPNRRSGRRRAQILLLTFLGVCCPGFAAPPGTAGGAAPSTPGLSLSGTFRSRVEYLEETFRSADPGTELVHASKLTLALTLQGKRWYGSFEMLDARLHGDNAATPVGTDDVNVTEPLQAYLGWRGHSVWTDGDHLDLRLGRWTKDLGNRRAIARNRYRNTINAFTGLHLDWHAPSGLTVSSFFAYPVRRLPDATDPDVLRANRFRLDEERSAVRFWGVHAEHQPTSKTRCFGAVLGLDERAADDPSARQREFLTAMLELDHHPGPWELGLELSFQSGRSRTTAADPRVLNHQAWFAHLQLGRRFATAGSPRIVLRYDYASGDDDPFDGTNERYDTLYGARRFDYGPTGVFGVMARGNLRSPGATLEVSPFTDAVLMLGVRRARLASRRDQFITNGLGDPTGNTSAALGDLVECRLRWETHSNALRLEAGAALFRKGRFFREVEATVSPQDSHYVYLQATFTF
ncbi:MAG: alginate export family protein [Pseudomonadota bacterium]